MAVYRSDSPESIQEIFDREGDALSRAGVAYPDLSSKPEGYGDDLAPQTVEEHHRLQEEAFRKGNVGELDLVNETLDKIVK